MQFIVTTFASIAEPLCYMEKAFRAGSSPTLQLAKETNPEKSGDNWKLLFIYLMLSKENKNERDDPSLRPIYTGPMLCGRFFLRC
jgi:hypothetical protein